jgi:hypothetical protein
MKLLSFLALTAVAAVVLPLNSAEAGHRHGGCGCCGTVYAAPAAASPAAAAPAAAPAVAQNNQGYRSYSYQPGTAAPAAPVMNYNSGGNYRNNYQPMWTNGANKALGRYN